MEGWSKQIGGLFLMVPFCCLDKKIKELPLVW